MGYIPQIFGKSAWEHLKNMDGIEIYDTNLHNNSCSVTLNGTEYRISRDSPLRWYATNSGHRWAFRSQWELLSWIADRL